MKSLIAFLPLLLASIAGQEKSVATSTLTTLLSGENERVKAGLSADEVAGVVNGLVKLAFGEQNALVALLSQKVGA